MMNKDSYKAPLALVSRLSWFVGIATLTCSLTAHGALGGGAVILSKGMVTATDTDGLSRDLVKKSRVATNDTVATGSKGFVVIRMDDKTKITLKPDSSMTIGEFNDEEGQEAATLKLLKGGFRTVTGVIGQRKPEAFLIRTPVATIGVRGTDMQGELCSVESGCGQREVLQHAKTGETAPLQAIPVGLYVYVNEGTIYIDNCPEGENQDDAKVCGVIDVSKGRTGYVSGEEESDDQGADSVSSEGDVSDEGKEDSEQSGAQGEPGASSTADATSGEVSTTETSDLTESSEVAESSTATDSGSDTTATTSSDTDTSSSTESQVSQSSAPVLLDENPLFLLNEPSFRFGGFDDAVIDALDLFFEDDASRGVNCEFE